MIKVQQDLQTSVMGNHPVPQNVDEFFDNAQEYGKLMMMYNCAIKEVTTKFDVLNDDMSVRYKRNPIEAVKSRIKNPKSIVNKLMKNGFPVTLHAISEHLNDVAGVRVICSFVEDIYRVREIFLKQDDVTLISEKDYIKNPKPNGYRSLHMIIGIPVFFADEKVKIRVEVQFRTIAMDFWASLEHQMKYKKEIKNEDEVIKRLKKCADVIAETDLKMQEINDMINKD